MKRTIITALLVLAPLVLANAQASPDRPIRLTIRRQVSDAVARALASDVVRQAFARIGATARPATPEALAAYVAEQQRRRTQIVAATHISLD